MIIAVEVHCHIKEFRFAFMCHRSSPKKEQHAKQEQDKGHSQITLSHTQTGDGKDHACNGVDGTHHFTSSLMDCNAIHPSSIS